MIPPRWMSWPRRVHGPPLAAWTVGLLLGCGSDAGPRDVTGADATDVADSEVADEVSPPPEFVPDFPAATLDDYSPHPGLAFTCSRTRALVLAAPGTAEADVARLAAAAGGTVAGRVADLGLYLVTVADPGDHGAVDALVDALASAPEIRAACHDPLLEAELHPDAAPSQQFPVWQWTGLFGPEAPSKDANWGLEATRVPAAWNLRDYLAHRLQGGVAPVRVLVNDGDFVPHGDLPIALFGNLRGTETHGSDVAAVIAATWGNGVGIDGVFPFPLTLVGLANNTLVRTDNIFVDSWSSVLDVMGQALRAFGPVDVVNVSLGIGWDFDPTIPGVDETVRRELAAEAVLVAALADKGHALSARLVFTVAAGNDGQTFAFPLPAEYGSPFTWAGLKDGVEGVIVVGATGYHPPSAIEPAAFSNPGPQVFAPGENVGVLFGRNAQGSNSGTSFAAPFVAGVVALLDLAHPGLRASQIATLLTTTSAAGASAWIQPSASPHVDVFAALMALDTTFQSRELEAALADVDDGTEDGCRRARLGDDGAELGPVTDDLRGDRVVDMRDFRRLRDAYHLLYRGADGLDGMGQDSPPFVPKMDLNGDGVLSIVGDPFVKLPAGLSRDYAGEIVWTRFDLNGDGLLDLATARPFKGAARTDLQVLGEVWGDKLAGAERDPDLEGWDEPDRPAMFERLLRSADVEVRVGNLWSDPLYGAAPEVEVHVWTEGEAEPEPGVIGPRARRVKRDEGKDALVFTVPLADELGATLHVSAYWVVDPDDPGSLVGAPVSEDPPATPPRVRADLESVRPAQDRVAVFGAEPQAPLLRYVYLYFDAQSFQGDVEVVDPAAPPINLLDGLPGYVMGAPPSLGCSATGAHVTFLIDHRLWIYRADGLLDPIDLEDVRFQGSPLVSDDGQRLVWVEKADAGLTLVVKDLGGATARWPLGDYRADFIRAALSPDAGRVLVSSEASGGGSALTELIIGGDTDPILRVIDLATGSVTPFYDKTITASGAAGTHTAHIQTYSGSWFASGDGLVLHATEELWALEVKRSLEETGYRPDPTVGIELAAMAPGGSEPTFLTRASALSAGQFKRAPVLSPDGRQILYLEDGELPGGPVSWGIRIRLMNTGSEVGRVLHELPSQMGHYFNACWLRDP